MTTSPKSHDIQNLDALTEGAFTAPTSGERTLEQLQEVFKELSARDKGAARPVRERLDEIRRAFLGQDGRSFRLRSVRI